MLACEHRADVAIRSAVDARHVVDDVAHAEVGHAMIAQERAELAGIEVIGVVGHGRVFGCLWLLGRFALRAQVRLEAHEVRKWRGRMTLRPPGDQVGLEVSLREHEGMEVVVVLAAVHPAFELRTLFEGGVALAEKAGLADAYLPQRVTHGGPGALAHADGRYVRRLEQRDREPTALLHAMLGRDHAGGQPTGRTAADDHESLHHTYKREAAGRGQRLLVPVSSGPRLPGATGTCSELRACNVP